MKMQFSKLDWPIFVDVASKLTKFLCLNCADGRELGFSNGTTLAFY